MFLIIFVKTFHTAAYRRRSKTEVDDIETSTSLMYVK